MLHVRRRSPLHAARAGVAAAWAAAVAGLALAFDHPLVLAALLAVVLAAAPLASVGPETARTLALALPFAAAIALVNPIAAREGLTVILRGGQVPVLGHLDVTLEATAYGGVLGLRALVVTLTFVLLARAADPDELLRGFRRISFRSAVTAALATRLVPVLARDARRMHAAQRARAGRAAPRLTVLRAVTTGALDRSVDVAATLEVRGYASGARPARRPRPWSRHDLAFAAAAVAVATLGALGWAGGVAAFEPYPRLEMELGASEWALAAGIVLVALLPFADRRGIGPA